MHSSRSSMKQQSRRPAKKVSKHHKKSPIAASRRHLSDVGASRLAYAPYKSLVVTAEEAVKQHLGLPKKVGDTWTPTVDRAMNIGASGFTSVGYPKEIPLALGKLAEQEGFQGQVKYNLFIGASTGPEFDDNLAKHDLIARRYPFQVGKTINRQINNGNIQFSDQHLSSFHDRLLTGQYNHKTHRGEDNQIDVAIVEATEITPEGFIVPGVSVGMSPEVVHAAKKVIIELNTALPSCKGLHDITAYLPPGQRKPFNITNAKDRIGEPFIRFDTNKVVAVVESQHKDNTPPAPPADETSIQIAEHIVEFFDHEVKWGRMPRSLLHLQSGIGTIANKVIGGIEKGNFDHVNVWTEVLQDTFLDFIDSGKLDFATSTSIKLSPEGFTRFYDNYEHYSSKILLRNQSLSNSPEIISRIGLIAMNTPVEVDIYGHANSTHVGSRVISGLGGSNDFLRNGLYSIMHTPSTRPSKTDPLGISCVVPMVSHCDSTEHDTGIFVTEQGLADMRGMSPVERAFEVIDKCAHPEYRPILRDYLNHAITHNKALNTLHEPHDLAKVFNMHVSLQENGSMRQVKY